MEQLSALDAQFLALETDTVFGHVASLAILDPSIRPDGRLGLDDLTAVIGQRLHRLAPLTKRLARVPLALDRPYWVQDPHFDLGYHVRELALPAPGSHEQLAEQVARLHARRLDRARPLWELYLIQGLTDGHVAIYTKLHHAAVDGLSGAEILSILYDTTPEGPRVETPQARPVAADPPPGDLELLARALVRLPLNPVGNLATLGRVLPHVDVVPSLLGLPGARRLSRAAAIARDVALGGSTEALVERPRLRAPRVPFSGRITPHRRFAFFSLSLAEVKQVKSAFGVTVNDVVVTLVTGAVRDWLLRHDALPERPVVAMVPVSVRTREEQGTFGNQVSVMMVEIPTHLEDPLARLRFAHESLRGAKERHDALPAKALQDVTAFIPPAVHARATRVMLDLATRPQLRPLVNLVISNVPGPSHPIYFAGAALVAHYPVSVIADGTGLNATVMSYRDRVDVGIVADREQMPDLDTLDAGVRAELAALLAAVPRRAVAARVGPG